MAGPIFLLARAAALNDSKVINAAPLSRRSLKAGGVHQEANGFFLDTFACVLWLCLTTRQVVHWYPTKSGVDASTVTSDKPTRRTTANTFALSRYEHIR
jgi:hypothetical protein